MKTPDHIEEVTVSDGLFSEGPYPPKGFVPIAEHALGNGDYFGLYWPVGKESKEPIICELWHDSWELNPAFSSLGQFLARAAESDDSAWVDDPILTQDILSPVALLNQAKDDAKQGEVDGAISHLETAVTVLPEYGAAWGLLAQQYRRARRFDDALKAVLCALIAPPCFGAINENLVTWFQKQNSKDDALMPDPLWQRRQELRFAYGGSKENPDYPILLRCIDDYEKTGNGYRAILLLQRYSSLMETETVSFQDRYGFSGHWFREMQDRLFMQHLGENRDWTFKS